MWAKKITEVDKTVTLLLKRLPKGTKNRLIELAVRCSRWVFRRFPTVQTAIELENDPHLGIREAVSKDYLRGTGIEIGALHAPLWLPHGAKAVYVDKFPTDYLRSQYPELSEHEFVKVDILDDGEFLQQVPDVSQDFVIANHFVEHCQDPLGAIKNMVRVLRENGILYISLPDKRFTFDHERPVTPIEHVLSDFQSGPEGSRRDHLEEWFRLVDKIEEEAKRGQAIEKALQSQDHIHYHVWTQTGMLELIAKVQSLFNLELELVRKRGIEVIIVLRKLSASSEGEGVAPEPCP